MARRIGIAFAVLAIAALRFAHLPILWVEEAYPMAAAQQLLQGRALYRDIWFDKPPAFAWFYASFGAADGMPLRVVGFLFVLIASSVSAWAAHRLWKGGAGLAGILTAFFFTFGFPATVIALTPDLLAVPLHVACLTLAATGQPFAAGLCAGAALLLNTKALLFLPAAALLAPPRRWPALFAGFVLPNAAFAGIAHLQGTLQPYWRQVWEWGAAYSRDTFIISPVAEGLRRTASWAGFHAALFVLALFGLRETDHPRRWFAVLLISIAGAWLGLRFFPRYFFHALPPLLLLAAAGWRARSLKLTALTLVLLLIPAIRFGPRYAQLWLDPEREWSDAALARDSREAAGKIRALAQPGDNLLVWGYRPDILALSRLPAATRFLDSQPLTGVLADRHLTSGHITFPELSRRHREELLRGPRPSLIADGLGPLNPSLAIFHPYQLSPWAAQYRPCAQTASTRIYCRLD